MANRYVLLALLAPSVLAAGSPATQMSEVKDMYPEQSPDGSRIVFQSNRDGSNQVWLMNSDGTGVRQITRVPGEGAETPVWSPDGRHIAYAVYSDEGNNDVWVMDAEGAHAVQVTDGPGYDGHPHWTADGSRIVFNSDRATPDHSAPWNERWHDIWSIRPDGSDAQKLTDCRAVCTFGSLSPDGRQLLFRKVDSNGGLDWSLETIEKNSEIYLMELEGNEMRLLASHPAFDGWPLWSPGGDWIVFASNRAGPALTGQIWLIRPDGSGLRQITSGAWGHAQPSFTADGRALLAYRFQETADWEYGGITLIPLPALN
jgi:TolB protein